MLPNWNPEPKSNLEYGAIELHSTSVGIIKVHKGIKRFD